MKRFISNEVTIYWIAVAFSLIVSFLIVRYFGGTLQDWMYPRRWSTSDNILRLMAQALIFRLMMMTLSHLYHKKTAR